MGVLGDGAEAARQMVHRGAELAYKLMSFPLPTVAACAGHAYPMGAFLLLPSDFRFAAQGEYRIGLNEVAIGLTLPAFAVELARYRLTPNYFNRTAVTGEMYAPQQASVAGFIDEVCDSEKLLETAQQHAANLMQLDLPSQPATKLKVRKLALQSVRRAIDEELVLPHSHDLSMVG